MDYTGYHEFPFPSKLSEAEQKLKSYFMSLSDSEQLRLLNGSQSYQEFRGRVQNSMPSV